MLENYNRDDELSFFFRMCQILFLVLKKCMSCLFCDYMYILILLTRRSSGFDASEDYSSLKSPHSWVWGCHLGLTKLHGPRLLMRTSCILLCTIVRNFSLWSSFPSTISFNLHDSPVRKTGRYSSSENQTLFSLKHLNKTPGMFYLKKFQTDHWVCLLMYVNRQLYRII